jgi:hypothetical protein
MRALRTVRLTARTRGAHDRGVLAFAPDDRRAASRSSWAPGAVFSSALALSLGLGIACASARKREAPQLEVPALVARVSQRCGEPLGAIEPVGAAARLEQSDEEAWALRVGLVATEFAPAAAAGAAPRPLGAHARLITAEIGGAPVEPRVVLAEGAWTNSDASADSGARSLLEAAEFGRQRALDNFDAVLLPGLTLRVEWRGGAPGDTATAALRVEVGRAPDAAETRARLGIVFEGEVDFDHDDNPATPAQRARRREALLLDLGPKLGASALQIALPTPFTGGEARGLVLELALAPSRDAEARAAAIARAKDSERGAGEWQRSLSAPEAQRGEFEALVEALANPERSRAALVQLGMRTGAELTADLALCATANDLLPLAAQARDALRAHADLAAAPADLGWRLERATLTWIATEKDARALPYEFEGVLLRRTGELGRSAAGLMDAATTCASSEAFARRLREENRIFLDDHAAAARVRAFDWLAARGWAPEGYDPLGDPKARRAALQAAEAKAQAP